MVNLLDELDDDVRYAVNFLLLAHEINLVVQSFRHLEDRVDEESIVEFVRTRAVKAKHLLTQRLFHALWEVVQQAE